jgi:hypothetical protein
MDGFQVGKPGEPDADKSIPFDDGMAVSHSPLNLGGGGMANPEAAPRPAEKETGKRASWPDRITGVKTFYTKLHSGAIEFLDEQICNWLRDNPGVTVKRTNATIGDVVSKRTEPNLIINVWF